MVPIKPKLPTTPAPKPVAVKAPASAPRAGLPPRVPGGFDEMSTGATSALKRRFNTLMPSAQQVSAPIQLQGAKQVADDGGIPTAEELQERVENFGGNARVEPLTQAQIDDLQSLTPVERQMYSDTLDQLHKLDEGEITPSQYMTNVMQCAANLAGTDAEQFTDLINLVSNSDNMANAGSLVGVDPHPAGRVLSTISYQIQNSRSWGGEQFNPMVRDSRDPNQDILHHFNPFLQIGYTNGKGAGLAANNFYEKVLGGDGPNNYGDLRNGYFAAMIGGAVRDGKLTPQQAVDLTRWAYAGEGEGVPWPEDGVPGESTIPWESFKVEDWIAAAPRSPPPTDLPTPTA